MASRRASTTRIEERAKTDRDPSDVFAFFDRPQNLERATSKQLAVSLESHPEDLRPGTIFAYRLKRWPLDLSWDVVVSEYDPPNGFTNVKARGFFPQWALSYEIAPHDGGAMLSSRLEYEMPSGLLHSLSDTYVVRGAMTELLREQTRAIVRALDDGR